MDGKFSTSAPDKGSTNFFWRKLLGVRWVLVLLVKVCKRQVSHAVGLGIQAKYLQTRLDKSPPFDKSSLLKH